MSDEALENEEKLIVIRRATFGKQVSNFLNSDIGRYLVARADEQLVKAIDEFACCNASDASDVSRIQNNLKSAENFKEWLSQAVQDGVQALNILEDRE